LLDSVQVYNNPAITVPLQKKASFLVYPNPAIDRIIVSGEYENAEIQISTLNGKEIYRAVNFNKNTMVDVSRFENGIYILKLITREGEQTRKIAIVH
jgi:hypothetical protein